MRASRGYVVFNIDYRGSYGYGRDFRTADYLVLGDDPIADVVKGVEYLERPDQNPEAFFSASAINHVDGLKAPILTLHGTADTSVNLTNSIKLVDELLKRGKRFEFEIYPGEMHFFARRSSQLDAWRKVERFFDEYVGQK